MSTYPLSDSRGRLIGSISIYNDVDAKELTGMIMDDRKVVLGGEFFASNRQFLQFSVLPDPVLERPPVEIKHDPDLLTTDERGGT